MTALESIGPGQRKWRRRLKRGLLAFALLVPFTCIGAFLWSIFHPLGTGSTKDAELWRSRFESIPDPETAKARYPEVDVMRYSNGEWIFGFCTDSHSSMWGGTIVVKDSGGQIRAFFGHVCGCEYLDWRLRDTKSLDDFYGSEIWRMHGFKEYHFP
jgi:hypothetical protein